MSSGSHTGAAEEPSGTLTDERAAGRSAAPAGAPAELPIIDGSHYELLGELARGGMGRILRARDRRLDRLVAVKQLIRPSEPMTALFEREIRITCRLQHPSIVSVYEAGRLDSGELFYAMRLVTGRSLKEIIGEKRTLEERVALVPHVIAIADALAYAHKQEVIHRDLKPSNVLVGDFGEVVVIDWGLATDLGLSSAEGVVGTPAYLAPELAAGQPASLASDVYALGAILYHVLAGHVPYRGEPDAVLDAVRGGPPPSLGLIVPEAPRDLVAVADKAMARDAGQRYPSARELVDELRRFQTGQLVMAHHYSLRERMRRLVARHRGAFAVAGLALIALAGLGAFSLVNVLRERDLAAARADSLALEQARHLVERDPAAVPAVLAQLSPGFSRWGAARTIWADALHRGSGRVLHRDRRGDLAGLAVLGDELVAVAVNDDEVSIAPIGGAPVATLGGHVGGVQALALAPRAGHIATVDAEGNLRRWRLSPTGATSDGAWRGPGTPVAHLALAPDGSAVAIVGRDGAVRVWRGEGAPVLERSGRPAALAIAPGGEIVALAGDDGVALIEPGRAEARLAMPGPISRLAFSPDGSLLAAAGGRGVALWRLAPHAAPTPSSPVWLLHDQSVDAVHVGGGRVVTSSGDRALRLWSESGALLREWRGHRGRVRWLAASDRSGWVASLGDDREVRLWNAAADDGVAIADHGAAVAGLAEASGRLFVAGGDGRLTMWDAKSPGAPASTDANIGPVRALAVARGGALVASGGADRTVRLWRTGEPQSRLLGTHDGAVEALAFSPDASQVASGGRDRTVRLWSLAGGGARVIETGQGSVLSVGFAGARVFAASEDGFVFAARSGGEPTRIASGERLSAGALAPDGSRVATGARSGAVALWSADGRLIRRSAIHQAPVRDVAFSADGRFLAAASDDFTASVISITDGSIVRLQGHEDFVRRIVFSPDGTRVATASEDGTVRVWSAESGEGRSLRAGQDAVTDLRFSADGSAILAGSTDGRVRRWRDDLPLSRRELRQRVGAP